MRPHHDRPHVVAKVLDRLPEQKIAVWRLTGKRGETADFGHAGAKIIEQPPFNFGDVETVILVAHIVCKLSKLKTSAPSFVV